MLRNDAEFFGEHFAFKDCVDLPAAVGWGGGVVSCELRVSAARDLEEDILQELGNLLMDLNQFANAEAAFQRILARNAQNVMAACVGGDAVVCAED